MPRLPLPPPTIQVQPCRAQGPGAGAAAVIGAGSVRRRLLVSKEKRLLFCPSEFDSVSSLEPENWKDMLCMLLSKDRSCVQLLLTLQIK